MPRKTLLVAEGLNNLKVNEFSRQATQIQVTVGRPLKFVFVAVQAILSTES